MRKHSCKLAQTGVGTGFSPVVRGDPSGAEDNLDRMSALWLLIGMLAGAGAAAAVLVPRLHALATEAERSGALEQLVGPLQDQLTRVDRQLLALDRERQQLGGRLEAQLQTLTQTGERLRTETGALVTALRKPNVRGQWGQLQLRRVVELAGMVEHCDFREQAPLGTGGGVLRPDLIVTLPGGQQIILDAKAPLQGVLDAYEASDEQERRRHLRDHARLLRGHVKSLAAKEYWSELGSAPDLVVMFLPGEHLYGTALEADPTLLEDAMAQRVVVATPTTLLAILRSVAHGWQQAQVADSARAIADLGRELHRRLTRLSGLMATMEGRLSGTVRAYNELVGSYEARVLPAAARFEELGAAAPTEGTTAPQEVTVATRAVRVDAAGRSGGLRGARTTLPPAAAGPPPGAGGDRPRACAPVPGPAPRRCRVFPDRHHAGRHRR